MVRVRMHGRVRSGDDVGIDGEVGWRMRSASRSGDGDRGHGRGSVSTGIGTGLGATNGRDRDRESGGTGMDIDISEMSGCGLRHATGKLTGRGAETDEGGRTIY